jgi:hypothetical protein
MSGQIPRDGGRSVMVAGKRGVVYDESPTEKAFARWIRGQFLDLERENARAWRAGLQQTDLRLLAAKLKAAGIDAAACKSLEHAYALARGMVDMTEKPWERIALAVAVLGLPRDVEYEVVKRWNIEGKKSLSAFAPYAAHVIACDLFFQFALAGGQIGTALPSNRVDIAYLNYLPFAHIFVSSDRLHRRAAPQFLDSRQRFVWGEVLKADLARINDHFMKLPPEQRERGIMSFAHAPPKQGGSVVRELRAQFMGANYDDRPPVSIGSAEQEAEIVAQVNQMVDSAPFPESGVPISGDEDAESVVIRRTIRKKRGSWWQMPKDIDKKNS